MAIAQKITSMTLALRRKVNIKVRQPLAELMIPATDDVQRRRIEAVKSLILGEVNVKALTFADTGLLVKKVKCNFRTMGKKYGKLMKGVAAAMTATTQEEIAKLEKDGSLTITLDGTPVIVEAADVEIISEDIPGWLVSNEGNITVALDITLTEELVNEGMARELINRIQNMRKEAGYEITDRIAVTISPDAAVEKSLAVYSDYISTQVLADSIVVEANDGKVVDLETTTINILITKR